MSNLARTQRRDSHEVVAEIFNSLERSVESVLWKSWSAWFPIPLKRSAA